MQKVLIFGVPVSDKTTFATQLSKQLHEDFYEAIAFFKEKGVTLIGDTMEVLGHVKIQTFIDLDRNTMQIVQKL
jgi:tRNA uridine 5-carbamoylmethylation protein Kti12